MKTLEVLDLFQEDEDEDEDVSMMAQEVGAQEVLGQNQVIENPVNEDTDNVSLDIGEIFDRIKRSKRNIIIARSVSIAAGLLLVVGGAFLYYAYKDSGRDLDETEVSFEI